MNNNDTKAVCKLCHAVMGNAESWSMRGEYWHPTVDKKGKKFKCKNAGKCYIVDFNDMSTNYGGRNHEDSRSSNKDIEPFERKSIRRSAKRAGVGV